RTRLDELANAIDEALDAIVLVGVGTAHLLRAQAREDRDDPEGSTIHQVLQEDDLKLERVLTLVVELIGIRVKADRLRGQRIDSCLVCADRTKRGVERLAAQRKGLPHRRVRRAEEDERIDP